MDYHQNARTTVWSREMMARKVVEQGLTLKLAAASFNVSAKTAAKWVRRFREQGVAGLSDRSSRPQRLRQPTAALLVERVEVLRRERWTGFRIARATGLSRPTVSRILRRLKLNRLRDLEPAPVVQRYEHLAPGDLLHIDIKRLVRIARPSHRVTGNRRDKVPGIGAEFVHIAIDDHSRLAFAAIYPDETRASVLHFLHAALGFYKRYGIETKAVITDNGVSYRSHAWRDELQALGIKRRRTRPYRPQTNGKAERFIKTVLNEWAYARTYQNSAQREMHLAPYIHQYNWHRPHASLKLQPPISRTGIDRNNLLSLHT
jgi:transposase InsO family protein